METITVESAVEQIHAAKTLDELGQVDDRLNTIDVEFAVVGDAAYRKAFDEQESKLQSEVPLAVLEPESQELPDDPAELKAMILALRSAQVPVPKRQYKEPRVRAGVSFKLLRKDCHFTQPQAEAIAQGLVATGKVEFTEAEVAVLVDKLRESRILGGGQPPMRIFRYYLAEGTIGYKARGFLQKVG